jgi:hypothetical protein
MHVWSQQTASIPVSVAICVMLGYFQTTIWFWEYPCVLTSSFEFFDQTMLQT